VRRREILKVNDSSRMQIFAKGVGRVVDSRNPLKSVSEEISVLDMPIWISSTPSIAVEVDLAGFLARSEAGNLISPANNLLEAGPRRHPIQRAMLKLVSGACATNHRRPAFAVRRRSTATTAFFAAVRGGGIVGLQALIERYLWRIEYNITGFSLWNFISSDINEMRLLYGD
jgi:hypothetical protein